MAKLDAKALGLTMGIVWGLAMFLLGISVMLFNWGKAWIGLISSCYIGYKATFLGSILGGIWGFIDGGITGLVVAWLYNKFAK